MRTPGAPIFVAMENLTVVVFLREVYAMDKFFRQQNIEKTQML
jgi:hypothetical protein